VAHPAPRFFANFNREGNISKGGDDIRSSKAQTNRYHQQCLKPWKIEEALLKNKGYRTQAAKDLDSSRGTLWRKIGLYQIDI